jgi:hypothetical protein
VLGVVGIAGTLASAWMQQRHQRRLGRDQLHDRVRETLWIRRLDANIRYAQLARSVISKAHATLELTLNDPRRPAARHDAESLIGELKLLEAELEILGSTALIKSLRDAASASASYARAEEAIFDGQEADSQIEQLASASITLLNQMKRDLDDL